MPAQVGKRQLIGCKRRVIVAHHYGQGLIAQRLIHISRGFIADDRAADNQIEPPFVEQRPQSRPPSSSSASIRALVSSTISIDKPGLLTCNSFRIGTTRSGTEPMIAPTAR